MYTLSTLLDTAIDAAFKAASIADRIEVPSIEQARLRMKCRETTEHAMLCAVYMENRGIQALKYVGPFGSVPFKVGDKVRIRRGTQVYTTNPKYAGSKIAGTTHVITVFDISPGWVCKDEGMQDGIRMSQPTVRWAGTGGYWCWVDANNVEQIT
jgi:hypothetical protein